MLTLQPSRKEADKQGSSMTSKSAWKRRERGIAADHGTYRTPLSGGGSRHTRSDSLHPTLYIEHKLRAKLPFRQLFLDTREKAKKEGKTPIIVLSEKHSPIKEVLLDYDDYLRLVKENPEWDVAKKSEGTKKAESTKV
jgi:hypothetical protein